MDSGNGALAESRIIARGPKASSAVHQDGFEVASCALSERMDEVLDLVREHLIPGQIVAFQRHGEDSPPCATAWPSPTTSGSARASAPHSTGR